MGSEMCIRDSKELIAKEVLKEMSLKKEYGTSEIGKGKNIVIDYLSLIHI